MSSSRAVGIDFGTSCTALARIDASGRSVIFRNPLGDVLVPSIVFFEDDDLLFGRSAKQSAASQPQRAAEHIKRDLGHAAYSRAIGGELLPPELIEGCLLKRLVADLTESEPSTPPGAKPAVALSVPACFNHAQRRAALDAGTIAGLEVLGTVSDPIAAALYYAEMQGFLAEEAKDRPRVRGVVFDLGGGKLDVAVIEVKHDRIRMMGQAGDAHLGGRDWDLRLAEHLASLFAEQFGEDPRYDMVSVRRLLERAEEAKHTLTTRQQARVRVERGNNTADVVISRQTFEEMTEDLVQRARMLADSAVAQAGLVWRDMNYLLVVGGATRMPMIGKMLEKLTGVTPVPGVQLEEANARGAALYAAHLLQRREGRGPLAKLEIATLTPHSLGVEWIEKASGTGENIKIIPRGSELPCAATSQVTTTTEDQRAVELQLLEGESRLADECVRVAQVTLRGLPARVPAHTAIVVSCQYMTGGQLNVKAHLEKNSEIQLTVELQRNHGLLNAELAPWRDLLARQDGLNAILPELARQQQARDASRVPVVPPALPGQADDEEDEDYEETLDGVDGLRGGRGGQRALSTRGRLILLGGYVVFSTLGLAIGYYILMKIDPSYNWWHLRLPGLEP